MHTRSRMARFLAVGALVVGLVVAGMTPAPPAYAADSISITPATSTANSNVLRTFTLTYTCSTSGGCLDSVVSIPTDTVSGNGANTDFSSWVGAGTCPALTRTDGLVTFSLGTVATGTYSCNFTVRAPNKTTLNGATATIEPTYTSSGGSATVSTPATLTVTAGRNVGMGSGVSPTNVLSGATMTLSFSVACGSSQTSPNGDLGLTALSINDVLPANFTFASVATAPASLPGTLTTPVVGSSGGTITYVGDGSECLNPANNRIVFLVSGTAAIEGVPTPVGEQICHTATSSFTYIDGFSSTAAPTPAAPCATVIELDWRTNKNAGARTMSNRGQYSALDNSTPTLYTFPGDWDGARSTTYDITVNTNPGTTNSGLSYDIKDPLPCLDNVVGVRYVSNEPGAVCANPAYIPRVITVTGFTPPAGAAINLLMADGSTQTVPYVAGTGWTLPTGPAVSQIDIPPFTQEGSNNFAVITFRVSGYASPAAVPGYILSNTTRVDAYIAGTTTPVKTTQGQTAVILVADPAAYGDGAMAYGSIAASHSGGCVARVQLQGSGIEITQGPSQSIYLAYLTPEDVGALTVPPLTATLTGPNGRVYTATNLSPSSQTIDYGGTGRTLVQWTLPAGLAVLPGLYTVGLGGFDVPLGAGCAGTFQNAMTIGYGTEIAYCAVSGANVVPPALPPGDPALETNGSPIEGNFCGASTTFKITATNPGFTVDKVVQGNLDPSPIGAGGIGNVSVDGGAATYTVSFTNTGQSTLANPVMYDLLPRIGDTRASSTTARGSQFRVELTSIEALPANVSVEYSQAINPCRPEVLATNPGCIDDWTSAEPASLGGVTALRFVYDGNIRVAGGFTAAYTVSTPPTAAGNVAWNSIGTNVTAGDALLGAAESSLTGLRAQSAQPAITKTASRTSVDAVGQQVEFTFTVTNNTAVALSDVRVSDALVSSAPSSVAPVPTCVERTSPAATCSGASTSLAAGQSAVFTATYVTTQADLDHGSVSDQATATATPPSGPALSNSTGVVTVTAAQNPELSLTKTATPGTVDAVGDVIEYTFSVRNSGNVTVRDIAIDETDFSGSGSLSAITCPSGSLAPGGSVDCTASYPVTQADLTAGSIVNTATASALDAAGGTVTSAESTATVTVDQVASLELVKSAVPSGADTYNAGQVLSYSFVVTNTGNVPVDAVAIDEVAFTGTGALSAVTCPEGVLAPAQQFVCTATYTLTQADVDSGSLSNTARASATASTGPVASGDSTVTTPQTPLPRLTLVKSANTAFVNDAGETVEYAFTIRNTGNVTISGVEVEEVEFTGSGSMPSIDCPSGVLAPGQQVVCSADYTVTQADIDAGGFDNTARAIGRDTTDAEVVSAESVAVITANASSALALVKSADVESFDSVGDEIVFSFRVTNTGNLTLTDVQITETGFTGSGEIGVIECPSGSLAPQGTVTCSAGYTVTQEDLDAGGIENTATAAAQTLSGDGIVSDPSSVVIDAEQSTALGFDKSVSTDGADSAGDIVTYRFEITNEGNVTVTGLEIVETAFSGTGAFVAPECGGTLAPGERVTCEEVYTLTQADIDAGTLTNTATAAGQAAGAAVTSSEDEAVLTIQRRPELSLVKSVDSPRLDLLRAGDAITYSFVVTNTGNVTITDPVVEEVEFSGTGDLGELVCDGTASLAPGEQLICTVGYTVTQSDVDAGDLSNTAVARGAGPQGTSPALSPESTAVVPHELRPSLSLVKTSDLTRLTAAGQVVTYTFTVTNTGNTTISEVVVSERDFSGHGDVPVVECPPSDTLLPGQIVVCTAEYTVVVADLAGADLTNTATAAGEGVDGSVVVSAPSTAVIGSVVAAVPPGGDLPVTGGTIAWAVVTVGVVLLASGVLLFLIVRRRRLES